MIKLKMNCILPFNCIKIFGMNLKIKYGKLMLKSFGKIMPENCKIAGHIRNHWSRLIAEKISKKANIHRGAYISGDGKNLILEEHSAIGINCEIGSNCFIGKHTMMGRDCIIYTQNHKFDIDENKFNSFISRPVYIGEYTWIGARVIILAGAHIGSHCIIGAGAVVPAKNYPDYSVIVGNPAVVKKKICQ